MTFRTWEYVVQAEVQKFFEERGRSAAASVPCGTFNAAARLYKQKVKVPLMLVGGIRSFEVADELVIFL